MVTDWHAAVRRRPDRMPFPRLPRGRLAGSALLSCPEKVRSIRIWTGLWGALSSVFDPRLGQATVATRYLNHALRVPYIHAATA